MHKLQNLVEGGGVVTTHRPSIGRWIKCIKSQD